ncbi:hypothetical protein ACJMK2_034969 [Sinanodonta woodiana]|uniref:CCHC-type domain-containing protein n=1 Tax=Sinanodonta woodiana TaxID=1069815 RepID=A0ABD3WTE9_SINWO
MTVNNHSYGEHFLRNHFRMEMEDREEGRLLKAFRDEWSQAIDMSHVNSINRPSTAQVLATLSARGIDASKLDTLTHIGRGDIPCVPQIGNVVARVTTSPPITKMLERTTIDVHITKFPREIPLSAFREGFEQRIGIKTLNIRKDTHKTMPGVNTGKIIVKVDARDAAKIPEFLKVCGLPIQTWFYGYVKVRPCSNCGQAGHDKWKCVQFGQNTQTDTSNNTHTTTQTQINNALSHSYAAAAKAGPEIAREPASGEVSAPESSSGEREPTSSNEIGNGYQVEENYDTEIYVANRYQILETLGNDEKENEDDRDELEVIEITSDKENIIEMQEITKSPERAKTPKRKAISPQPNEGTKRSCKENEEDYFEEKTPDTPDTTAIKKILKEMTTASILKTKRSKEGSQDNTKPAEKITIQQGTIEENTDVNEIKKNVKKQNGKKTSDKHETKTTPKEKADENEFVTPPQSPKKKQNRTKATGKKGVSAHTNTVTQLQDKNTDIQQQQQQQQQQQTNNTRKGNETQQ